MISLAAFTQKAQAMPYDPAIHGPLARTVPRRDDDSLNIRPFLDRRDLEGIEHRLRVFRLAVQDQIPNDVPQEAFRAECEERAHSLLLHIERKLAGQERTVKRSESEVFTAPATWFDHLLHDLRRPGGLLNRHWWLNLLIRRLRAARYKQYTVTATVEVNIKKVFPDLRIPYRSVDIVTVLETPSRIGSAYDGS